MFGSVAILGIPELTQQRDAAVARGRALLDKAAAEKRDLTVDEKKIVDDATAEADRLNGEIATAQRAAAQPGTSPAIVAVTPAEVTRISQEAVTAERVRVAGIMDAVRGVGLPETLATELVTAGATIETARARLLDELVKRSPAVRPPAQVNDPARLEEVTTRRALMANALEHRVRPQLKLEDGARQYRGMRLLDMARESLEVLGVRTRGMLPMEVASVAFGMERAGGMLGTSDFPAILANVANKTLRQAYDMAPSRHKEFTREISAVDFKPMTRTQLGEAPQLLAVNASGEIKRGSIGDGKETYQIGTYARIMAINRQAIINDDLDAFSRLPMLYGRSAADLEADIVWGILTGNAVMSDGTALFHADHGNLNAGGAAAVAVASIGNGRAAMRQQKGLGKKQFINATPRFLLGPSALETTFEQFISGIILATTAQNSIPATMRSLVPIAEPRLDANSATRWYLAADPAQIDTIEYAYLEGQPGVYLEQRLGFEVDGLELKCRLDFGAKAIDWRGLQRNDGA
jgi:phage major head subunit gpT-like protein